MWFSLIALLLFITQQSPQPYFDFSKGGSGFYGAGREAPDPTDLKSVRIGAFGPGKDAAGLQLRAGIELAIEDSNRNGGYRGRIPFEMVFKADDGPWGVVGNRVVELAYEDKVWTIIGGLDGQRTHIAELIAAKAWLPVVTPSASDVSIDYANVPWVFRCAPADSGQVELLVGLAKRCGYKTIVALTQADREAYAGYSRLQERLRREQLPLAGHLQYVEVDPAQVVPRLKETGADAIILWGTVTSAVPLIEAIRAAGMWVPVLAPAVLAVPELATRADSVGQVIVAAPFELSRRSPERAVFEFRFKERTGLEPLPLAYQAYDSARLVISSIQKAGLNRARIRDELAGASFEGIAGKIEFDPLRGNTAAPVLMALKNRRWSVLNGCPVCGGEPVPD